MAELKTCPFCGAELCLKGDIKYAEYQHPDNDCILASADSEYGPLWIDASDNKMVEKWNRRIPDGHMLMEVLRGLEEKMKSGRAAGINKYIDLDGLLILLQRIDEYHEGVSNDGR